ncbi:fluoride efflux transporter FluC [Cellulomonas sp. Marseille-Q8402]
MAGATRPAHPSPASLGLVMLGGAAGAASRYGLTLAVGASAWPWATWLVNLSGAYLLALLTGVLTARGADAGRRAAIRLLLGTGFLGAYTTYSALAVDTERLAAEGRWAAAVAYALSTVLLGLAASFAGLRTAAALADRSRARAGQGVAS